MNWSIYNMMNFQNQKDKEAELFRQGFKTQLYIVKMTREDGVEAFIDQYGNVKKSDKKRTLTQNNCIHKFSDMAGIKLNEAGITQRIFFEKHNYESSWSGPSFLENVWRKLQESLFGFRSTRKLNTKQVGEVYETINSDIMTPHGIYVPWPSKKEQDK